MFPILLLFLPSVIAAAEWLPVMRVNVSRQNAWVPRIYVNIDRTKPQQKKAVEGQWSYDENFGRGPSKWREEYRDCNEFNNHNQSPIDLPVIIDSNCIASSAVRMRSYAAKLFGTFKIDNNQLEFSTGARKSIGVKQPRLRYNGADFTFEKVQLRWSSDEHTKGSEHSFGGRKYDVEIHIHHRSTDGRLAIVAIPGHATPHQRGIISPLINNVAPLLRRNHWDYVARAAVRLSQLVPYEGRPLIYEGGLTYPPCTRGVTWIVYADPVTVGAEDMRVLRSLHTSHPELRNNFRPIQEKGDREIFNDCTGKATQQTVIRTIEPSYIDSVSVNSQPPAAVESTTVKSSWSQPTQATFRFADKATQTSAEWSAEATTRWWTAQDNSAATTEDWWDSAATTEQWWDSDNDDDDTNWWKAQSRTTAGPEIVDNAALNQYANQPVLKPDDMSMHEWQLRSSKFYATSNHYYNGDSKLGLASLLLLMLLIV